VAEAQAELPVDGAGGAERLVFRTDAETGAWWGVSRRSVIRHRQAGAPFAQPDRMEDWWAGTVGRKTPQWLSDGVAKWRRLQGEASPPPSQAEESKPDPPADGLSEFEILASSDWGVDEQIQMQRGIVKAYAKQLADAARRGHDIAALDRRYQAAAKQLQTFEARRTKILIESGAAWPRSEVEAVVLDLMHAVNAGLDYLPVQLRRELGLDADQERRARDLVDRLKALWRECQLVPDEVERRLNDAA
jgi:hypothetical protein